MKARCSNAQCSGIILADTEGWVRPLCHACWVEAGEQEYEPTPSPSNDWEFVEISKYNDLKAKHKRTLHMLEIAKDALEKYQGLCVHWNVKHHETCGRPADEAIAQIESLK